MVRNCIEIFRFVYGLLMQLRTLLVIIVTEKPTDYAAILRAANQDINEPPEWLAPSKFVYSPEYGVGEVMAVLGRRLIVKFIEEVNPTQFDNWEDVVEKGLIKESGASLGSNLDNSDIGGDVAAIGEEIDKIPNVAFQSVARDFATTITRVNIQSGVGGSIHPIPEDLPSNLHLGLQNICVNTVYSHQLEALAKLRAGYDLTITTPTASGKTLCYNLPIIEACIKQPDTRALYIFPLKALALDQMRKLQMLVKAIPNHRIKIALMTGDTPRDERQQLFIPYPPNVLAVSPDLLHHYLYNIRRPQEGEGWRLFLRQLRYVVIDESHTYIGAFGAHFANLMRRLRLAVDAVGGNSHKLQFICSSATIGNPQEMALRFSGRTQQPNRSHLIRESGADSAGRTLLCLEPSSAANVEASKMIISWLQHNLSGIVFCNSRAAVKGLLGLIQRETQRTGCGHLANQVALFYSSLIGERRREIISKLQSGQIKVIISTSSLEAGIDLPELDCCLIRGFPGSLMSFWQRVGRAGRKQHGLVIYLPLAQNPIDVYYAKNPQQLLSGDVECSAFNPDYPTILGKHLECGCIESALALREINHRFGHVAGTIADSLLQQNKLYLSNGGKLWGRGYPHKEVNLRSAANTSINLIDKHSGDILEKMSLEVAYREVFPQAIYFLQDENGDIIAYRSESLNVEKGEAQLAYLGKETTLYTEAESELDIVPLSTLAQPKIINTNIDDGRIRLTLAWGEITTSVTGYRLMKRIYGKTCKNQQCANFKKSLEGNSCPKCRRQIYAAEVITLQDEIVFETPLVTKYQAPCVLIDLNEGVKKALREQVSRLKQEIIQKYGNSIPEIYQPLWTGASDFIALHSLQHQIIKAVPLVVLSSSLDVDGIVTEKEGRTYNYFYDTCEGGNGAAEAIFHDLSKFAAKAYALASGCDCETGCPRCLHSSGCPQHNEPLNKDLGLYLLDAIFNVPS
ncbi:DEAD/DEAH box helicase-like [Calothrix sp. PCC 7716]|nr:DEAD/DEAH box helicase-like [Calothrix sp. PCC 7716]